MREGRRAGPGEALARIGLAALSPAGLVLAWLPGRLGLWLGRRLGDLAWLALPGRRAVVRANLTCAFGGEMTAAELGRLCRRSFEHLGMNLVEACVFYFRPPSRLLSRVEFRGVEHLDAAGAGGRGMVLLTAHLGNWELAGRLIVPRLGRTTHVVLSTEQDGALEDYLRADSPTLRFVTRRHATSTLGLLAALRRREAVAMQADRPTGGRGDCLVPFFGAPAAFPLGPFVLARAAGAPVVPAFCVMTEDARYRITIEPAIWVKPGGEAAALATMVGALERAVRASPTQWFNFFDVWGGTHDAA